MSWVLLTVAGGVGALLRFALDSAVARRTTGALPYGTLAVNTSGSFALGLVVGLGIGVESSFVVGTGLIGAFTTFSTWMFEAERLGEEGDAATGSVNIVLSVAAGLAAAAAGWAIGASL